jgi:hypothetical protein
MKIGRDLMARLIEWQASPYRKPLILKGVRQCGKTWLLQEFGSRFFEDVAYFNFETQKKARALFDGDIEPKQILLQLAVFREKQIQPQKTLIIFDEIQACPAALNALKYFCEQAPEYSIVAAGSLLGVALAAREGFPVGKVSFLELMPCSFKEYLRAVAPMLAEFCATLELGPVSEALAGKLEQRLREYLVLGGMPAVLSRYIETQDLFAADEVLQEVITAYELDFSKHAPTRDIPKLFLIWKSIPEQLAREHAKFMYGEVRPGARAKDLEDALRWLQEAGLVCKVNNVTTPQLPLSAHENRRCFKLYMSDLGVLRKLAKLPLSSIINASDVFGEFKGRLTENFVLLQLKCAGFDPICYWTSLATAEVDFLVQDETGIVPVEVKSGLNRTARSLRVYREKYRPELSVRTSLLNLRLDAGLLNLPLYLINEFPRLIRSAAM